MPPGWHTGSVASVVLGKARGGTFGAVSSNNIAAEQVFAPVAQKARGGACPERSPLDTRPWSPAMTEHTIVLPPDPSGNGKGAQYELRMTVPKRQYLAHLKERWWVMLVLVAFTVGTVLVWETVRTGRFQSFAQLYVASEVPVIATGSSAEDSPTYFGTQMEVLKSARVQAAALEKAGITPPPPDKPNPYKLDVFQPLKTSILLLQATGPDGPLTQKYLAALMEEYLSFKETTHIETAQDVLAKITQEVAKKDGELTLQQHKYSDFQRTNNLAVLEEEGKILGLRLTDLNLQLDKARLQRDLLQKGVSAAVAADTAAGLGTNTSWAGAASTNLAGATADLSLKSARVQLAVLRQEKTNKMTTLHLPERALEKLSDEIARMETTVAVLEKQNEAQRKSDLEEVEKRIESLEAAVPPLEAKVGGINERLSQSWLLKNNIQREQSLFERLMTVSQNVDLSKNVQQERLAVLQAATAALPEKRYLPVRIAVAVALGLAMSLGLVFVWYLADDRLVSARDIRDQFGEPLLGLIPQIRVSRSKPQAAFLKSADSRKGYAESFRHLRSALLLSELGGKRPQTLLLTGAVPAEGKTTIAVNLARVLAQSGLRVVLVDANTHGGETHRLLGLGPQPGVLDYLRGNAEASGILQTTDVPGLTFVPAGKDPGPADGLFMRPELGQLIDKLKAGQDFIVLDSPPVLGADDAALLVPYADTILVVVRPFYSRSRLVRQTLDMLYQRKAKQVAFVLNRARKDDLTGQNALHGVSKAANNGKG